MTAFLPTTPTSRAWRRAGALALAATMLVPLACGGDDDDTATTDGTTTDGTTTDGATPDGTTTDGETVTPTTMPEPSPTDDGGTTDTTDGDTTDDGGTTDDGMTDTTDDGMTDTTDGGTTDTTDGGMTDDGGDMDGAATEARDRAMSYVDAVADGDLEAAWELMATQSQDALGSFADFENLSSALAEGIAAYARADDLQTFVVPVEGANAHAVTLMGTVEQEGPPSLQATSMIVRAGDDGGVSPFENALGSGFVEFQPPSGSDVTTDDALVVAVPDGPVRSEAFLDDEPAGLEVYAGSDMELPPLRVVPADQPSSGPHAVTVVVSAEDGAQLTAWAAAYRFG